MYLWAAAWLLHPTLAIRAVDDVDDEATSRVPFYPITLVR